MKYLKLSNLERRARLIIKERLDCFLQGIGLETDIDDLQVINDYIHFSNTDFGVYYNLEYSRPWSEDDNMFANNIKLISSNRIDDFSLDSRFNHYRFGEVLLNAIIKGRTTLLSSLGNILNSKSCISQFIRKLPENVLNFLSVKEICYKEDSSINLIQVGDLTNFQVRVKVVESTKTVHFLLFKKGHIKYTGAAKLNAFKGELRKFIKEIENEI